MLRPQLSESDRAELTRAVGEAMLTDDSAAARGDEMSAAATEDVRDFFCEHWDQIRKVLLFIAEQARGMVRIVIKIVITAGDFLRGRLCPNG
jgi:hypothetical protein